MAKLQNDWGGALFPSHAIAEAQAIGTPP